ncbi:short-chain dehydrogenase [Streptomyces sp. NRRL WC-3618]|jgi:NAD(P)-dependent dehydrogenase (short-subunit alcohol dehydrogenase family)|uniref:SDR family NAD(P)-dependent oxidoreductase n=1 Tax=Streptomyces sp. NRRL WC-3618 TaxID=1519490 RepID=UPI0006AF7B6F|nr:SDR family oxidoreductase [Streptomyces sp. NRRL WC-3618]KOV66872.1 short-chain dehydrogenase [Streptomyces sp. NRRL WC-3618]
MDLELGGRTAIVTGGSMGIGRATARELAAEGATVVITARRLPLLERAAKELEAETGGRVVPYVSDTDDTESVRAMVRRVADDLGRIDILVNGAAAPSGLVRNSVEEADPELLLADINTKVVGYFRCAQAVTPHMRAGGYGRIVNIGGLTGRSSHALSGLRNLAIVHLTKSLSDQLGPSGITVNTLHPGVVETEHIHELYEKEAVKRGVTAAEVEADFVARTPVRRILEPVEIAQTVCFLASPRAAAITGESLGVDGGLTRGIFL